MTEVATETPNTAAPAVEATPATNDDLTSLLKEWSVEEPKAPEEPKEQPKLAPEKATQLLSYVEQLQQKELRETTEKSLEETVKNIIAASPDLEGMPPKMVRAFLHYKADESADLRAAWLNREAKPELWKRTQAALAKEIAAEWSQVPKATVAQDRAAVQAAVRNLSATQPREAPPDYSKMSLGELMRHARGKAK